MHMQTDRGDQYKGTHDHSENERAALQKWTIANGVKFAITGRGQVYGLRNHDRPLPLGHIACVLRDGTVVGGEFRIWWRDRLESDEAGRNIVVTGSGQFYFVPCEQRFGNDDLTHDEEPEQTFGPSRRSPLTRAVCILPPWAQNGTQGEVGLGETQGLFPAKIQSIVFPE